VPATSVLAGIHYLFGDIKKLDVKKVTTNSSSGKSEHEAGTHSKPTPSIENDFYLPNSEPRAKNSLQDDERI